MNRNLATLIGFVAILTWAFLAMLSVAAGNIPPFQLAAMTFAIGGLAGAASWPFRPHAIAALRQSWPVWVTGAGGLCLYHCVYFFAIQSAPPVEASLIAYLWPLLIVFFASFLPGEKLRAHHMVGVLLGFLGAVIVITKGFQVGLAGGIKSGHILALACAFIWSGYSVVTRRFGKVPTDIVVGYCLVTAVVALTLHLALETTVWPQTINQWMAILLLGLFPVGIAFYAWDHGCKHGDIMLLGTVSYASPLISVLVLIVAGYGEFHWSVALACSLIVSGALVASKDAIRPARKVASPVMESEG